MKRVLGVVSMLLMFHLALVAGNLSCAKHSDAIAVSRHAMQPQGGHNHSQAAALDSEQKDQCETPISPDCCSAQAPCAPTLIIAETTSFTEHTLVARALPTDSDASAPVRFTAPETPPPRA